MKQLQGSHCVHHFQHLKRCATSLFRKNTAEEPTVCFPSLRRHQVFAAKGPSVMTWTQDVSSKYGSSLLQAGRGYGVCHIVCGIVFGNIVLCILSLFIRIAMNSWTQTPCNHRLSKLTSTVCVSHEATASVLTAFFACWDARFQRFLQCAVKKAPNVI